MTPGDFKPRYLTLTERGDVVVATIDLPQLTEEENTEELGRGLFALVEQHGCQKVVVSLEAVKYATSSVLGKLISLHRKLHRNNGKLVVCACQPPVAEVLRTSRLLDYFNIADDVDGAVAMFEERGSASD